MIKAEQITEILSLYKKHGWNLQRVLLTPQLKMDLTNKIEIIFDSADIIESDIDAVWLSRFSSENRESWEIRRLSETGYALVEVFEEDDEEEVREEIRRELEARMKSNK
jgi:hypothetical protein